MRGFIWHPLFVPLTLLLLTLGIFANVLFVPGDQVLSKFGLDTSSEFIYWRQFGFAQMRAGHIALWNPHLYSGAPFMGGFQAALFYPPNLIYLLLPVGVGINLEFTLHVFLLGLFMSLWLRRYQLHPLAVLLGSAVVMFGAETFLRVFVGHLATVDAMAWAPLLLLTVDELLDHPSAKWIAVGIFALTMQILAGHPQTTFNTAVACGLYAALGLPRAPRRSATVMAGMAVIAGAALIAAAQLWCGFEVAAEGRRGGGSAFQFVASFSFPPENLLTLLAPRVFGNEIALSYWGRWVLWEECAFFGITGLTMAVFGATVRSPKRWVWIVAAAVLFAIGLGDNTPLLYLLYRVVPGFAEFREHCRFIFEAELFLAMLAGFGVDRLISGARGVASAGWILLGLAMVLGLPGLGLDHADQIPALAALWEKAVAAISASGVAIGSHVQLDAGFLHDARQFAASALLTGAGTALIVSLLLFARLIRVEAAYALALFGVVEVVTFAHSTVVTFSAADTFPTAVRDFLADKPGDYRILHFPITQTNSAMMIGANDIWGYDPAVSGRYAELFNYLSGSNPDDPLMRLSFKRPSPVFRIFRLRYALFANGYDLKPFEVQDPLPPALLLGAFVEQAQRDEIFDTLTSDQFDPEKTAILEDAPDPEPVGGDDSPGTVQLVRNNTDSLTISATLTRPSILLLTDSYSRYWKARPLPGSSQADYTVMPADYALMAIPLAAGTHRIALTYEPPGYLVGRWVSLVSLLGYLILVTVLIYRSRAKA
ncbi:MAG TPA: hypothetical protein VEJ86_12795 [Candidatus Binataceae bacterium]|nr:hypothetical protein [Candidatus Binataceae bacterium]